MSKVTISKYVMDKVYPGWQEVFGDDIPDRQELIAWIATNAQKWTVINGDAKSTDFDAWMRSQGRGRLDWARVHGRLRVREPELALLWELSN
jgi:hypothetical protein